MRKSLRVATVVIPAGFVLACVVGDGGVNIEKPMWYVTIEPAPDGCPVPPGFGSRFWAEYADEEDVFDVLDTGKVVGAKLRWMPFSGDPETENTILDCPFDGSSFECEPYGEDVDAGRLHIAFSGERDGREHVTGTVDVVGTSGDNAVDASAGMPVVWCTGTWSFDAVRVIDPSVRTARADDSCALDGTVASVAYGDLAVLEIVNNSSTAIAIDQIDASGAGSSVGSFAAGSITGFDTTVGVWYRVNAQDDGHCLGLYEVSEPYTVSIVHGSQD